MCETRKYDKLDRLLRIQFASLKLEKKSPDERAKALLADPDLLKGYFSILPAQ
jgi:hypothetical protein